MPSPAYEQILQVQASDLRLRQLHHHKQHHPLRDEIAGLEAETVTIEAELGEIEERHHEFERQRKRLEDEASSMKAKRVGIDNKLYGGEVTASKELLALQDEATMLLGKQNDLEEQELELMETLEGIGSERDGVAARLRNVVDKQADAESALTIATSEIDGEVAEVERQRAERVVGADQTLLARYEALRDQFDGVAVARLVNGTCDGCHIRLSAIAVDQIGKMADDVVVTCEECGRLLVH